MHHVVPGERAKAELTNLLLVVGLGLLLSASLLLALALLEEGLGDEDLVLGRDGTVNTRLVRSPAYTRGMSKSAGGELLPSATFSAMANSKG